MKPHKSLITLILANLVPVIGVVFLDWDVFAILFLFWLETIVILAFSLARTVLQGKGAGAASGPAASELLTRYFMLLWGAGFTFIQGVFVVGMIGPLVRHPEHAKIHADGSGFSYSPSLELIAEALGSLLTLDFMLAVLAMFLVYGGVFIADRIKEGRDRLNATAPSYVGRIILLHVTIIIGALIMVTKHIEHGMIYVFVGVKLTIDLLFYWVEKSDDGTEA